jgi:DDE superfamily endonuclease
MGWIALLTAARPLFGAQLRVVHGSADRLGPAPGRRTITAMIAVADPACGRAHDAYHRFVCDGAWSMSGLWRLLAIHAVATFAPKGVVSLDCDDTLFHKSGRRVAGARTFRDAVRSTSHRVVYALGLNVVVVTLRVTPPWGDMPIAVPVNARLHKKKAPTTTVEHAAKMLAELADWLPDRQLHLCADGAYACLAGQVAGHLGRRTVLHEVTDDHQGARGALGQDLRHRADRAGDLGVRGLHRDRVDVPAGLRGGLVGGVPGGLDLTGGIGPAGHRRGVGCVRGPGP